MVSETSFAFPSTTDDEIARLKNVIEQQKEEIKALEFRISTLLGDKQA